jgi:hypothetical protein
MNGENIDLVLGDYKYVPELWVNLFSITKSLLKGGILEIRVFSYSSAKKM